MITRRAVLAGAAAAISTRALSAAAAPSPYQVVLPAPTGPYAIGTTQLHLVDHRRADPWVRGPRELMVSVWRPVRGRTGPRAPYAGRAVAGALGTEMAAYLGLTGDKVDLAGSNTNARLTNLPARSGGVLLYSPGSAASRVIGTNQAEELASHGYMVVSLDHTGEAPVQFPGGRVVMPSVPWEEPEAARVALRTRVEDIRFVLDRLRVVRAGIFGYSMGGSAAASAMMVDRRLRAGVNLDGGMSDRDQPSEVTRRGLDRPFLLYGGGDHSRATDPSWAAFWENQRGWKQELRLPDGGHGSFGDYQFSLPGLAERHGVPAEVLRPGLGTVDPGAAVTTVRGALTGFFRRFVPPRGV